MYYIYISLPILLSNKNYNGVCHFHSRKWLPQPLRKLSQGKVEKQASTAGQEQRATAPLKKTSSDKRFKVINLHVIQN